jgi:hypothetical protein
MTGGLHHKHLHTQCHAQEVGSKSRPGHVIMMAGAAVSCFIKKQPVVSIFSKRLGTMYSVMLRESIVGEASI